MTRQLKYLLVLTLCYLKAPAQLLPFRNYTVKDGLISNEITAVTRDDRGLLWVGTPFGINWFDGSRFTEPPITAKRGQLYVTGLFKDPDNKIWMPFELPKNIH